jgi:hypothetical protein
MLETIEGQLKNFITIGTSVNTTGISGYIMGAEDKKYLSNTFGTSIDKASVTRYCIKFNTLKEIGVDIHPAGIRD